MRLLPHLTAAALLAVAAPAAAQPPSIFIVELLGLNEVPPNSSQATGFASLFYDIETNGFEVGILFEGLTTPAMGAHIHRGAAGVNGPIIVNLTSVLTMSVDGGTDPFFGTLSDEDEINLFAGNLYVNVHTPTYPGGEIRGQLFFLEGPTLNVVPEPGTVALVATGLLGLGVVARRRLRHGAPS